MRTLSPPPIRSENLAASLEMQLDRVIVLGQTYWEMRPLIVKANPGGLQSGKGMVKEGSWTIRNILLESARRALSAWSGVESCDSRVRHRLGQECSQDYTDCGVPLRYDHKFVRWTGSW